MTFAEGSSRRNVLALCVFLDLFAVSLIVPLLPVRYKELGVEPVVIGMIGSVYSIAQIVGGLILGVLSDRLEDRRTVLLLSFGGAAVAYAMVGAASTVWFLVLSRVVVGLFKQTMTASKAMAAAWSDDAHRAEYMGLINSMATAAWVTGSAVTGMIRRMHPAAPSVVAVALYAVDAVIVMKFLPPTNGATGGEASSSSSEGDAKTVEAKTSASKSRKPIFASIKRAFGNGAVGRFLAIRVLYGLVARAAMTQQDSWEMDRFGLKTGQIGSLRTTKSLLSVVFQGLVAGRAVRWLGERAAFAVALVLAAISSCLEYTVTDVKVYAVCAVPCSLVASMLSSIALESLMTQLVPKSEIGASLASLDVLNSAVGVVAPLIGGAIIQYCGLLARPLVAGVAYVALLAATSVFMPSSSLVASSARANSGEEKTQIAKKVQ
mmetsp:Transcript_28405/g.57216  ORF Transcript_28405/g.57216 Transcript_28405/m.57216 type:complete len:434 (-) Transcript_28405:273-1574(-)